MRVLHELCEVGMWPKELGSGLGTCVVIWDMRGRKHGVTQMRKNK